MNSTFQSFSILSIVWLTTVILVPQALGQTSTQLEIRTYAGLTIRGEVGKVYSVEYSTDLSRTNDASAWRCLEFVQLPTSAYLWVDKSAPATEKRFYRASVMEAPANMVFIPSGTFQMGSPESEVDRQLNESPQTLVTISRGFWMGKYEVTQGDFLEVTGTNPSWFKGVRRVWDPVSETWIDVDFSGPFTRPVESLTWDEATNYCAKLTERERAAGRIPTNCVHRLPTEAEWEYACRAGTSTRFSYGDDPEYTHLINYAWCALNSQDIPHPVGQKLPNPWGLYDMHGNVREWCQGWWSDFLPGGIVLDYQGPETGWSRPHRGGVYYNYYGLPKFCRSAYRMSRSPSTAGTDLGFRIVLAADQQ